MKGWLLSGSDSDIPDSLPVVVVIHHSNFSPNFPNQDLQWDKKSILRLATSVHASESGVI
jgi:hypothetical protein